MVAWRGGIEYSHDQQHVLRQTKPLTQLVSGDDSEKSLLILVQENQLRLLDEWPNVDLKPSKVLGGKNNDTWASEVKRLTMCEN